MHDICMLAVHVASFLHALRYLTVYDVRCISHTDALQPQPLSPLPAIFTFVSVKSKYHSFIPFHVLSLVIHTVVSITARVGLRSQIAL